MAATALNELKQQIELVRQEAYAAGFAAAMQAIREFADKAAPGAPVTRWSPGAVRTSQPAPARAPLRRRAPATARPQKDGTAAPRRSRGANTQMVEQVLQANAPRALRPAEIRSAIQRDQGASIAFPSIRHALDRLAARNVVEHVDAKTWRYHLGAGASDVNA